MVNIHQSQITSHVFSMSVTQLTFEAIRGQLATDSGLTTASGSEVTTTGSITSGTNTLTVASVTSFSAGHGIKIAGAGTGGGELATWIESITGSVFTLHAKAIGTVTDAAVSHDDRAVVAASEILPAGANFPAEFPAIAIRQDGAVGYNFPDTLSGMLFLYIYYQSEPGGTGQPLTVLNLIADRIRDLLHGSEDDISNASLRIDVLREVFKSGLIPEIDISETTHSQAVHYEYMSQLL